MKVDKSYFDGDYMERMFVTKKTRVTTQEVVEGHAKLLLGTLDYYKVPAKSVLDVGCGLGWWRKPVTERPDGVYFGIDISSKGGADKVGDIRDELPSLVAESYDLVVSQCVLPYLNDAECRESIYHHKRVATSAIHLMTLTPKDLRNGMVAKVPSLYFRTAEWYNNEMSHGGWVKVGKGLWVHKNYLTETFEIG